MSTQAPPPSVEAGRYARMPVCVVHEARGTLAGRVWLLLRTAGEPTEGLVEGLTLASMARTLDASRRGVQKALDELERLSLVVRKQEHGKPTVYILVEGS